VPRAAPTPLEELGEVLFLGGLPALVLAFVGGWFLMRRALVPVTTLTRAIERVQAETLRQELPRSGNGDELDRLTEVFNSMMVRLDNSFTHTRDFTLHASHELKTPLTILRGQIELRLRDPAVPPADRELFADQLDEIARLTKIVDSLTFLARADSGQLDFAADPVRLDQLVRDSFADAQLLGRSAGLQVELAGCDEATVRGDRHRLKQLLLNLTDNAIKYNQPAGRITLSLRRNNGAAELTIANTGPGIAPEKLPRVFDRFYRGDPAHSNDIEGCGMGLSIAQWIVKAHQGTIQITSSRDGLTTVNIRLPAEANPVASA
jgi:signal transduction histidine kinase